MSDRVLLVALAVAAVALVKLALVNRRLERMLACAEATATNWRECYEQMALAAGLNQRDATRAQEALAAEIAKHDALEYRRRAGYIGDYGE
jgi:hypothetical protein